MTNPNLPDPKELFGSLRVLTIVPTYRCNARCRHCQNDDPSTGPTLSIEQFTKTLDTIIPVSPLSWVYIWGGEPMMEQELTLEMIRRATARNMKTSITTNGFWGSTPEKADSILATLKEAGLKDVYVSTDAFHQEWIPFQSVLNVLKAASRAGFNKVCWISKYLQGPDGNLEEDIITRELISQVEAIPGVEPSMFTSPLFKIGRSLTDPYLSKYALDLPKSTSDTATKSPEMLNLEPDGRLTDPAGRTLRQPC